MTQATQITLLCGPSVPTLAQSIDAEIGRIFCEVDRLLQIAPGYRLFSILVIDSKAGLNRRVYSSNEQDYPSGGSKPLVAGNAFYSELVENGRARICVDREECIRAYFDHELIFSLGCESAINYPIRWQSTTLGSLNILDVGGRYSASSLSAMERPASLASDALRKYLNLK